MSMQIIEQIMEDLRLDLSEEEKIELDEYLENGFGIIGAIDHCETLNTKWETERDYIKELILKWVNKKKKKAMEILVTA